MSFFCYFANLNGQYLEKDWSDFQFILLLNAQNLILNRVWHIRFSIVVFSKKLEKLIFGPGNWNWQYCKILTRWKKTDSGFGLSDPKLYVNKWFCFRTKSWVNFVDLCYTWNPVYACMAALPPNPLFPRATHLLLYLRIIYHAQLVKIFWIF